eukprot:CAMPEP_0196142046 /NCGR_PEP_ID=MMETSP0910-20130528/10855_1 /TAXON_ID=49265 /ORGANISM="Thalassiosira rotula, Strain GSO102" /LENGTH=402 /DNA_ID=CAMNT_0041403297 /DNA_START=20 /DNA_END=1228 /DNA_ORIENTATION=-
MKISAAIIALTVASATAFAPSAPTTRTTALFGAGNTDPVDPTMNGIDDNLAYSSFDPTSGDSPAVSRNNNDGVWVKQRARPRRNRKSAGIRNMVRENIVTPANFIYPLFIHEEDHNTPIDSMPGCSRHCEESMMKEVGESLELGVGAFVLFPKVDDALKTNLACEAYNPEGIVHRSIRMIKEKYPEAIVVTDVALDPYSDQGHDGVVENGVILNDITVNQLCKQAVSQARAGADIVAPSDMQDGRVKAIRDALDSEGFTNVSILSYTAKYASAYYGPFRDALDSHPGFGDKKTYQQDPANGREALIEAALDAEEGADMLMVKPGMPYLDIIRRLKDASDLPIAAYHVSGEYSMLKAAVEKGWLDEKDVVLETLTCFKRAGADIILTYYAKQAAQWMKEDGLY